MDDLEDLPEEFDLDRRSIIMIQNVIRCDELNHVPNPGGLGVEIFTFMHLSKDNLAQISADGDAETDTYNELLTRCIRTAMEMTSRGVKPNDVVIVVSYNHLNSCVPYIAATFICAVVTAIDPSIPFEDSKYLVSLVKPKMVFVDMECKDKYEKIMKSLKLTYEIITFDDIDKTDSFTQFISPKQSEENFEPTSATDIDKTAVIFFSGGHSGLPKGVCLSHSVMLCQGANFLACGFPSTLTLSFSSLYWLSTMLLLLQSIYTGNARLVCRRFIPELSWNYIDNYQVTLMFVTPFEVIKMLKNGKPDRVNTSSLGYVAIFGSSLASEYMQQMRKLLPSTCVSSIYNLTEVGGILTAFRPGNIDDMKLLPSKVKSCGRPMWGFSYKVCHLDSEEALGPHESGELRLRTDYQLSGYYGAESTECWDTMGWLVTGDVCYYDEDFCFYIVDHTKEVIKFQSWRVTPTIIEDVIMQHPGVREVVVFGVPHRIDGEQPMAVIVVEPDAEGLTPEDIQLFVKARVDDMHQLRGGIRFVDTLPHTPSAKVKRRMVKETILKQLGYRK